MVRSIGAVLALALAAAPATAAKAETYFAYSKPEGRYGACYGCDGSGQDSAMDTCRSGGTACEPVLACADGWSAVSFPDGTETKGVAMVCGLSSELSARTLAFATCMDATNSWCMTFQTGAPDGSFYDYADDWQFSMTYLAQILLKLLHYDISGFDGQAGPQTKAAVRAFERDMGQAQTGKVDQRLVWWLEMALGGRALLWKAITVAIVDPQREELQDVVFAWSAARDPIPSFGNELMAMSDADRLTAIAIHLRAQGQDCTIPALTAAPMFDEPDEMWDVNCAEGNYSIMLNPDGSRFIDKHD